MARKILLADDSVTAQNMGRKILADAGYDVITVNNGSAALKKIAELKPDLIVLDVYMPGYSGLEVCQRVKEAGDTCRIPILLTVGKLEPFKPEEAKRVRAEGYIVKPFEASELLSALTKLEDKIVPRSESSKPGRFARAIAAVEEGRYDKTMVVADDDTGWKNRISFPSKKKRAAEPEDGDDPAIYNALNKDLRTVVDRHPTPIPHETPVTEPTFDLGALAPEGLPKDVTPEEIAALAAAAAQIQGKIAETTPAEVKSAETKLAEAQSADIPRGEAAVTEHLPEPPAAISHEAAPVPAPESAAEPAPEAVKIEAETATQAQAHPAAEPQVEIVASASAHSDQPLAQEEKDTQPAAPAVTPPETAAEAASLAASSPAETMAVISSPESLAIAIPATTASENEFSSDGSAPQSEAEPVTMAVAAGAEHIEAPTRWTAVSIALVPEETSVNLEEEMRKAQLYMAVADTPPVEQVVSAPEIEPAPPEPAPTAEIPSPVEAEVQVVTPAPEPEALQADAAPHITATEVMLDAVRDLEMVPASIGEPNAAPEAPPAEPELVSPPTADFAIPPAPEAPRPEEARTEEIPVGPVAEIEAPPVEAVVAQAQPEELKPEEAAHEELAAAEPGQPVAGSEPEAEQNAQSPEIPAPEAPVANVEESPSATENVVPEELVAASQVPAEEPAVEPVAPGDATPEGVVEVANKESEIAATTAAAWANWRKIRETGNPKDGAQNTTDENSPADEAAMAVAAGAEQAPEDPGASEGPEIASIVDSVLADLRPKIVEEISRKLSKKKKK